MGMNVLLFTLVFLGGISLTDTKRKDDTELLQRLINLLADKNGKDNQRSNIEKKLAANDNDRIGHQRNGAVRNSFKTKQTSEEKSQRGYYVKFPQHQLKDAENDELYRAIDAFIQAKRAKVWQRWLQHGGYKGSSTTARPAPTTPPATPAPARPSWCRWWFWWRRC